MEWVGTEAPTHFSCRNKDRPSLQTKLAGVQQFAGLRALPPRTEDIPLSGRGRRKPRLLHFPPRDGALFTLTKRLNDIIWNCDIPEGFVLGFHTG